MYKWATVALSIVLVIVLLSPGSGTAQAPPVNTSGMPGVPYVERGQSYQVLVGAAAVRFTVLAIEKDGLVLLRTEEDASGIGIRQGTFWWLNLKQVLLIQQKNPEPKK